MYFYQFRLVEVHLEEYPIVEGQGFDFYCLQGKDVYWSQGLKLCTFSAEL